MRTVRAKIHNGQYVDFTFNPTSGLWEAQLQAPSETSYFQPDHKYVIQFEAWDEDGHNVILNNTDPTYGSELAVRVREQVNTVITLIQPSTPPYIIHGSSMVVEFTVTDAGGSLIDEDSIKLTFGSNEYGIDSEYMTVTAITGGYHCVFDADVFMQDGTYDITIQASDNDENTSIEVFPIIIDTDPTSYVYDRTLEDVLLAKTLREKYLNGTITEAEKLIYATDLKGARNRSDFLRIINAMEYIALMFDVDFSINTLPEIPTESYIQELVDDVEMFRSTLPVHEDTPYTPSLPINTYKKMNDLEKILFDIHDNLRYRFTYYCDDGLYADQNIGTIE